MPSDISGVQSFAQFQKWPLVHFVFLSNINSSSMMQSMTTWSKVVKIDVRKRRKHSLECKRYSNDDVSLFMHNLYHALFFAITLLAPTSVYNNQATELLTCFTVYSGKARRTGATVFMMGIFMTCSSVYAMVIFVTMQFCNTSLYLLLLLTTCHIHTCTWIHKRKLFSIRRHSYFVYSVSFSICNPEANVTVSQFIYCFHGYEHCMTVGDKRSSMQSVNASIIPKICHRGHLIYTRYLFRQLISQIWGRYIAYLFIPASNIQSRAAELQNMEQWASIITIWT